MKNIYFVILILFLSLTNANCAMAAKITGQVEKAGNLKQNQVIDENGAGVAGARVKIPQKGFMTYTDENGHFDLNTKINEDVILSVEKSGYRPFSLTIDKGVNDNSLVLGIEKVKRGDIVIDTTLYHLGDNNYSPNSANSGEFRAKSIGIYLSKRFDMGKISDSDSAYLIIGSVIGLDTKLAKDMRQNNISGAYSSPAEIYFNGQKIGELKINGDNQRIVIPNALIGGQNELTVKTGRNLFQRNFADYDDMEIMNLSVEVTERQVFGLVK